MRSEIIPGEQKDEINPSDAYDDATGSSTPVRISWARLLKRVFGFDLEHCPHCGGELKIIAAIEEQTVIAKILAHLGLPTRAPPHAPARNFHLFEPA